MDFVFSFLVDDGYGRSVLKLIDMREVAYMMESRTPLAYHDPSAGQTISVTLYLKSIHSIEFPELDEASLADLKGKFEKAMNNSSGQ